MTDYKFYGLMAAILVGTLFLFFFVVKPYVEADCRAKGGEVLWEPRSWLCVSEDGRIIR